MLSFGYIPKGGVNELINLAKTLPAVTSITAERLTKTAYQNQYGIFPHSDLEKAQKRPLALVAYHPKEDIYEGSLKLDYFRKFYHLKIKEHFGLDIHGFFDMEYHDAEMLCQMAKAHIRQYEKTTSSLEGQLQAEAQHYQTKQKNKKG